MRNLRAATSMKILGARAPCEQYRLSSQKERCIWMIEKENRLGEISLKEDLVSINRCNQPEQISQ